MREAVGWLRQRGVPVILTAADGDGMDISRKRPAEMLDPMCCDDVVYVAGAPTQVDAVRRRALEADATFYADPFYAADTKKSWREWATLAFRGQSSVETAPANV